jgi:hypothetical protein
MALSDSIERVANTAILASLSLAVIRRMYPDKYEQERKRRSKRKPIKATASALRKKTYKPTKKRK